MKLHGPPNLDGASCFSMARYQRVAQAFASVHVIMCGFWMALLALISVSLNLVNLALELGFGWTLVPIAICFVWSYRLHASASIAAAVYMLFVSLCLPFVCDQMFFSFNQDVWVPLLNLISALLLLYASQVYGVGAMLPFLPLLPCYLVLRIMSWMGIDWFAFQLMDAEADLLRFRAKGVTLNGVLALPEDSFCNLAGNIRMAKTAGTFLPRTLEELQSVVRFCIDRSFKIRAKGQCRSASPAAFFSQLETGDSAFSSIADRVVLVDVRLLSGVRLDETAAAPASAVGNGRTASTPNVIIRAGTTSHEMSLFLEEHGLAVDGSSTMVSSFSVVGTCSTGSHGSGQDVPAISDAIESVTLVDGNGAVRKYSLPQDAEEINALRVSLGCMGVIYEMSLKTVPSRSWTIREEFRPMDEFRQDPAGFLRMHLFVQGARNQLMWFPALDAFYVRTVEAATAPEQEAAHTAAAAHWSKARQALDTKTALGTALVVGPLQWLGWSFTNRSFVPAAAAFFLQDKLSKLYAMLNRHSSKTQDMKTLWATPCPTWAAVHNWNLIDRLQTWQVEVMIPADNDLQNCVNVLQEAMERVREAKRVDGRFPVSYCLEMRVIRPSKGTLAASNVSSAESVFCFEWDTHPESRGFVKFVEPQVRNMLTSPSIRGRLHWGKAMAVFPKDTELVELCRRAYPPERLQAFEAVRSKLDPRGLFQNDFMGRLLAPFRTGPQGRQAAAASSFHPATGIGAGVGIAAGSLSTAPAPYYGQHRRNSYSVARID